MSTIKKLGGAQYRSLVERRREALGWLKQQVKLPGKAGSDAAELLNTLQLIHRAPMLNGVQKDSMFRRVLIAAKSADTPTTPAN